MNLIHLLRAVHAQTLYTVSGGTENPFGNASITVSAVGVGADGATTYVEVGVLGTTGTFTGST